MIISTAAMCLAMNIYHETRAKSIPDAWAVASVTLSRAKSHDRVCEVVFAHRQFSWTTGLSSKIAGKYHLSESLTPCEVAMWARSIRVANAALAGRVFDFSLGAKHYHADYVRPAWADPKKRTAVVSRHLFYRNIS
jgi:spore germination cell wall hydrolase CwlJ-like protein